MGGRAALVFATLLSWASLAQAGECEAGVQVRVDGLGTDADDLLRVGELAGVVEARPRVIRRGGVREETLCDEGALPRSRVAPALGAGTGPAYGSVPLRLTSAFNSAYPTGANDGLMWAGRGFSSMLSGGGFAKWGPVTAAIVPEVAWAENATFQMKPNGLDGDARFGNAFYGRAIDLPQRFGDAPYYAWSAGQSFLRADLWNVGIGVSNENLWLGPGLRNSLTMSNAGPGFPHAFLGTSRPADALFATVEVLAFWGRLDRTRFSSGEATHPMISGLVVTFAPTLEPNLTLGVSRIFLQGEEGLRPIDYFAVVQPFPKDWVATWSGRLDNPNDNQVASLFGRWSLPSSGFEVYAEWGREDHEAGLDGVIREPDHSQAYLAGLQKVWKLGRRWLRFQAELTHLQEQRPLENQRGVPVWYAHGQDLGYTHQGQLLGAWIGPGADSQRVAADLFTPGGYLGAFVERVRRNDAVYWERIEPIRYHAHDAELAVGVRHAATLGVARLSWEASYAIRYNRDFIRDERNLRGALKLAVPMAL